MVEIAVILYKWPCIMGATSRNKRIALVVKLWYLGMKMSTYLEPLCTIPFKTCSTCSQFLFVIKLQLITVG